MPKVPEVGSLKLRALAKEHAANKIVTDGDILRCEACDVDVPIDPGHQKQRIMQHIETARHVARAGKASNSKQMFVGESLKKAESVNSASKELEHDLASAFVQSGIPLKKVNSGRMKRFHRNEEIREFLRRIDKDAKFVTRAKALVDDDELKVQLVRVSSFSFLPDVIEKLEQEGLTKERQWKIYCEAAESFDGAMLEKYHGSLKRNPDVQDFVTEKNSPVSLATLYAPLVSVEVERSFSLYKYILSDRRQSFTCENMKMHNVAMFNQFLFDSEED